jgi:hypothetical protein
MWYKNSFRRHLCDMHIDDWNDEFLSKFSPEEYLENLKKAKVDNAMLYFQSHVGLCYYPTETGKMHRAFLGREDMMRRLVNMCRENNISVTGYYSLIYNNWAYDNHPEWRMKEPNYGKEEKLEFTSVKVRRYGRCCPNNPGYRAFVSKQIKEILNYFEVDGMFFDMLFWPRLCDCDYCRSRFKNETGFDIPQSGEDWTNSLWLLHLRKRREWLGEFAQSITDEVKEYAPNISVEHNVARSTEPTGMTACAEGVLDACDYVGGDLYGGFYRQSFTCKFYRNITKNQPFEYMFSRCEPNLTKHTVTRSVDAMKCLAFLTIAHHGATLVIDAIDPVGTLDGRVYERIGQIFEMTMPYEKYLVGDMIEDVGVYYSMRSKFNAHDEPYTNFTGAVNSVKIMIDNNICCGVTGGFHDINKYKLVIAPCLTGEDEYDFDRIEDYVKNGGHLYISGGDCDELVNRFFDISHTGRTREKVVYIAPSEKVKKAFGWFNSEYPLHFDGSAPIMEGMNKNEVLATLTLPYTAQDTSKFASIHSNPPGIKTDIPAIAATSYGKGMVLWSALPIEAVDVAYQYGDVFIGLLREVFGIEQTVYSDAPENVEIVAFTNNNEITVSSVQQCNGKKSYATDSFTVFVKSDKKPKKVLCIPSEEECGFSYENGSIKYTVESMKIFDMRKILF